MILPDAKTVARIIKALTSHEKAALIYDQKTVVGVPYEIRMLESLGLLIHFGEATPGGHHVYAPLNELGQTVAKELAK